MKSILIVGAGPAGLVAAKTLLQHAGGTKFKVTIFEAAERVGGMWRVLPGEKGDRCSPDMRTNLSRFTMCFSDLSYTSVELSNPGSSSKHPGPPPMFPKAWQVGRYLESYAKKFLPAEAIRLNRRVTAANLESSSESDAWVVTSVDQMTREESRDNFDYLIVASGFFDRAASNVRRDKLDAEASIKIQHSSQFRDVASLADDSGKIVVMGGGISGSEAAATAAFQISNAKFAPGQDKPAWVDSKVYHIFNRPFYALPRYLPLNPYNPAIQNYNLSPQLLPLDFVLYDLARRNDNPISAWNGQVPPDKAKKGHEFLRSAIGGDQRDTGHVELVSKPANMQYPAYNGIVDTYTEFVRSGLIVPIQGRAENLSSMTPDASTNRLSVEVVGQEPWTHASQDSKTKIDDVAGIIDATGYQVRLQYLSDTVKRALDYDQDCNRIPFLLSRGATLNPKVPNIAFVGFYEGPYWGVMEMQSRLIAQTWDTESTDRVAPWTSDVAESRSVRQAIENRALDVPQFSMQDYAGLMEELSRAVGVQRVDSAFGGQAGPGFPARYQVPNTDTEAALIVREMADILQQSENKARFVAAAAFRGMQGKWTLQRKVDSRHASMPGGALKGTAYFHPRIPTSPAYAAEYLYIEDGTLTMDTGMTFSTTRRYIYRYDEDTDTITAWFVEEDGLGVGNLFNTWEFYAPNDTYHGWLSRGYHWCSPDNYKSNCEFRFRGASVETFGITYDVSGPKKDYTHESWYSRPRIDIE